MDTPAARKDWRTVLDEQGREIRWLADHTDRSRRTVYGYSRDELIPPTDWLDAVSVLLGVPVGHLPRKAA